MSTQVHNAIAYNKLTPISQDFGDDLTQAENQGFRYREEKRRIQAIKDQKDKEFEDKYAINPDDYYLEDTEFRTVNDVGREAISQVRDQMYNIKEQLKANPNDLNLKKQWDKLTNSARALRDGHTKFKAVGEDYVKRLENDEISGLDEKKWKDRLEAYDEGRIKVKLDKENNLSYHFFDKDGKFIEEVRYKDLIQGSLRNKVDINQEANDFLEMIGAVKYDESRGGFVKSISEWGDKQNAQAERLIDVYLEDKDTLDDILFQAGLRDEDDIIDPDKKKQMAKNYLTDIIKGMYDESLSLKPFNRPQGRSLSFGDRQKMKTASTLFDISMRAASGEQAALDQIVGSRIKVQDGDKTVEKIIKDYAVTEKGTAFLDENGDEVTVIENDTDVRRRALKFAMLVENGQSADNVQSTFETGEGLSSGRFNVGQLSETKTPVEVADIDLSIVDKLPEDEESAVDYLKFNYSEKGFTFKSPINPFVEKISITAPNGLEKDFSTSDKEQIKTFLEENSDKRTKFESNNNKKGKYD